MRLLGLLPMVSGSLSLSWPSEQIPIGPPESNPSYAVQTPPLDTKWTYEVGTDPWPQYPRPKLARSEWKSLNGIWTYANASSPSDISTPPFNQTLSREVLVPFCLESGLSGIQGANTIYSWYRTTFTVPSNWTGDRVLLNFGAVDYEATIFINGVLAKFNRGGYFAFSVDVTDYLNDGQNELVVFVFDPTDMDPYAIPCGKQALEPSHIFYRPCSGIWQTVWIESVPKNYIKDLYINAAADGQMNLTVNATGSHDSKIKIAVYERGSNKSIATHKGTVGSPITFKVKSPKKWTPDSPNLYDITIEMDKDMVQSYTGFRTITKEDIDGVHAIFLNGEPIFPFGTLDQGYWPDGLYTPPTYEAMTFDIKALKHLGYNMLRKHVKIESALYYAAADELGILVMQDMPNLRPGGPVNDEQQAEFERQLEIMITQFRSYTSIFAWVIYNEGWGQIGTKPEIALTDLVHNLDPTRLVNAISGWTDHGAGEFSDIHHYTSPQCGTSWSDTEPFDPSRIGFNGEFGGLGHNVSVEHLWKVKKAIDDIGETYEMWDTLDSWNTRGLYLITELRSQIEMYSCAGAVWTQAVDVEGEVNGMMTYDRRVLRADVHRWREVIQSLYTASGKRWKNSGKGRLSADIGGNADQHPSEEL